MWLWIFISRNRVVWDCLHSPYSLHLEVKKKKDPPNSPKLDNFSITTIFNFDNLDNWLLLPPNFNITILLLKTIHIFLYLAAFSRSILKGWSSWSSWSSNRLKPPGRDYLPKEPKRWETLLRATTWGLANGLGNGIWDAHGKWPDFPYSAKLEKYIGNHLVLQDVSKTYGKRSMYLFFFGSIEIPRGKNMCAVVKLHPIPQEPVEQ